MRLKCPRAALCGRRLGDFIVAGGSGRSKVLSPAEWLKSPKPSGPRIPGRARTRARTYFAAIKCIRLTVHKQYINSIINYFLDCTSQPTQFNPHVAISMKDGLIKSLFFSTTFAREASAEKLWSVTCELVHAFWTEEVFVTVFCGC